MNGLNKVNCSYAFTGVVRDVSWRLQYERDAPIDRKGVTKGYANGLMTAKFQAMQDFSW